MAFSFAKTFNSSPERAYMNVKQLLEYNGGYTDTDEAGSPVTEPVAIKQLIIGTSEISDSGKQATAELDLIYDGSLGSKYDTDTYKLSAHEGHPVFLNLPDHMTDTVIKISTNAAAVKAIAQGNVGIRLTKYSNKYGDQVGVEWVDI